ncbi:crotonase/enoyl-CoA hydratase family protein [Millisia brevis]|uniref:crotonase/enoyl-CoA hydratase family protein n=1 Tax=Millisia brevis TaxID=264148 RepID=UPI00082D997E|nr:crotonase/enoyl-CoA hydratase family protein [Millisia brevis]
MTASWKAFTVETADHIATVTMTSGRGNLMGGDFWRELPLVFGELDADSEVRAIILRGSGDHFSYGLNLADIGPVFGEVLGGALAEPRTRFHDTIRSMQNSITAVANCRKPVIAAISGWCIGGALDLISAVDIRYASADARFSIREVKVGMVADVGSLARLPKIIGDGHLRELTLTGRDFDAAKAEKIGLVTEVFANAEQLAAGARATALELAANPPLVVQGIKQVLDHSSGPAEADSLRFVAAWNAAFMPSEDMGEAVAALMEKRPPRFSGR